MAQWINLHQNNSFINQTQLPLLCEKFGAIATPSASPTTNFTFLKHTINSTLLTLRTKKVS